ncbi:MAG: AI-2E family transporter [Caulobacterales bacterium]
MSQQEPAVRPLAAADRRLIALAIFTLGALLVWKLAGLLLLLFAAILLAVALSAMADGLRRVAPIPKKLAIIVSAALIFGVLGGVVALYGWRIVGQYREIIFRVRESTHAALVFARAHEWTRLLLQRANDAQISDATDTLGPLLGSVLGASSRYLAYAAVVLVSGIFLALEPDRYTGGALLLVPPSRRARASDFLAQSGSILRRWLISRLIVMAAIGVLVSIGLRLLGIEAAVTLGLTGALLTFIPFIGALMAAVPAVLVALTVSPWLALATGLLFWAVHFIEGTFITPVVQDEEVYLPPVTTIFATLAFAVIFGPSGVIVASPLVLVIIVAIRIFYLEDRLGEPAAPLARRRRSWPWIRRRAATTRERTNQAEANPR